MAIELVYGVDVRCIKFVDPDLLGGVAGPSLAENRPKPTKTKIRISPKGLTDTKYIYIYIRFYRGITD